MSDNFRVTVASIIGTTAPGVSWFTENLEPVLRSLLALGQIAVAIATVLYILRKWKNARVKKQGKDS